MREIFVSSTFKDMQSERDLINKYIEPKLREEAKKYNEDIYFTDLRWGVNTENLDSDEGAKKVLEVCFDEIIKCKPYIIVFLGERYGWIPSPNIMNNAVKNYDIEIMEPVSVTELEIQFGALQNETLDNCIFCFREELDKSKLPEEKQKIFLAEDEIHKEKLNKLKQKIIDRRPPHIIYYHGEIDENGEIKLSENLEKEIVSILLKKLQEQYQNNKEKTWQQEELAHAEFFINRKNRDFVGRKELVKKYLLQIEQHNENMIILSGKQGIGKSSILSKLYIELKENDKYDVFPFICGNSEKSSSATDLMNQLNYFIASKLGTVNLEDIESNSFNEAREVYLHLMKQYNEKSKKTLVILVDALNQMFQNEICLMYEWAIPVKKQIIFTTMTEEMLLPQKQKYVFEKLPELEKNEIRDVINSICQKNHKELSETVIQEILKLKSVNNPLYLQMLLQRLMMMDEKDFEKIRNNGDNMEAINKVQIELLKAIPETLTEICKFILDAACIHMETEIGKEILNLIAVSKEGLTRKEIKEILLDNHLETGDLKFSALLRYMRNCFIEKENGRIDFSHDSIRQGFLDNISDMNHYNLMMFHYIEKLDDSEYLKYNYYVKFAFLTGNMDKAIKNIYQLTKQNKMLEANMQAMGIKQIMDNPFYEVHIDFTETIIEETLKTKDIDFIKSFLLETLVSLFNNGYDEIKYVKLLLELTLDFITKTKYFIGEKQQYLMLMFFEQSLIANAKLGDFDQVNELEMFIDEEISNVQLTQKEILLDKIKYKTAYAENLFEYEKFSSGMEKYEETITLLQQLKEIDSCKETLLLYAKNYSTLATIYQGIMQRKSSKDAYERANELYNEILQKYKQELTNDEINEIKNNQMEIKMNIGDLYVSEGQYDLGEKILKETLEENNLEENNSSVAQLHYCNNYAKLGYLYSFTNKELAKEYYQKCLEMISVLEAKYPKADEFLQSIKEDISSTIHLNMQEKENQMMSLEEIEQEIVKLKSLIMQTNETRFKEELIKMYKSEIIYADKSKEKLRIYNNILSIYKDLVEEYGIDPYKAKIAECYGNIGEEYYYQKKWNKAIEMLNLAYDLLENLENDREQQQLLIPISTYLGDALIKRKRYEEAAHIFFEKQKALIHLYEKIGGEAIEEEIDISILEELIPILIKLKNYEIAMKYSESFIRKKFNDPKNEQLVYQLGKCFKYLKICGKKLHKEENVRVIYEEIMNFLNDE